MEKEKNKEWKVKFHPEFGNDLKRLFSNSPKYLIPRKISDWKCEIKWAWQRVFRGYDDRTGWDFHHYISEYFPKILRQLKDNHMGCPSEFYDGKKKDNECWKWGEALEKIAKGFESAEKMSNSEYMVKIKLEKPRKDMFGGMSDVDYKFDKKIHDKLQKDFDEGMKLFHRYFFNLWD